MISDLVNFELKMYLLDFPRDKIYPCSRAIQSCRVPSLFWHVLKFSGVHVFMFIICIGAGHSLSSVPRSCCFVSARCRKRSCKELGDGGAAKDVWDAVVPAGCGWKVLRVGGVLHIQGRHCERERERAQEVQLEERPQ